VIYFLEFARILEGSGRVDFLREEENYILENYIAVINISKLRVTSEISLRYSLFS